MKGNNQRLAVLVTGLLSAAVLAQTPYAPSAEHYEAARQARDCAVYRSLVGKANQKISSLTRVQKESETRLREARGNLVACARAKGARGGENEILLAELCPSQYEQWLEPSYGLQLISQDLNEARRAVRLVGAELEKSCPSLPRPPVSLPRATPTASKPVASPKLARPAPADVPSVTYDEPGDPFVFVEITRTPAIDLSGLDIVK